MRMRSTIGLGLVAAAVALLAAPAQADTVIYDNGSPDLVTAYYSDFSYLYAAADGFVLQAGAETITDIHWWGAYDEAVPQADDFTIRIFTDDGGSPAASPLAEFAVGNAASRTDTGQLIGGYFAMYAYEVDIAPLTLAAGTDYYISIINDTAGATSNWGWATSASAIGGHQTWTISDQSWSPLSDELAFCLTGDTVVPEPASLSLLGLGLAGFAVRRFRKR